MITFAEDPSIRQYAEHANTIARWTDVEDGGHFAALEHPTSSSPIFGHLPPT